MGSRDAVVVFLHRSPALFPHRVIVVMRSPRDARAVAPLERRGAGRVIAARAVSAMIAPPASDRPRPRRDVLVSRECRALRSRSAPEDCASRSASPWPGPSIASVLKPRNASSTPAKSTLISLQLSRPSKSTTVGARRAVPSRSAPSGNTPAAARLRKARRRSRGWDSGASTLPGNSAAPYDRSRSCARRVAPCARPCSSSCRRADAIPRCGVMPRARSFIACALDPARRPLHLLPTTRGARFFAMRGAAARPSRSRPSRPRRRAPCPYRPGSRSTTGIWGNCGSSWMGRTSGLASLPN